MVLLPELPGDCNHDRRVDSADFEAFLAEIFDGDGASPDFTPLPPHTGDPIGCNANEDDTVDSGDLSCLARRLEGQPCLGDALPAAGLPQLILPDVVVAANRQIRVAIHFEPAQQGINSLAFELSYDPGKVELATGPGAIVLEGASAGAVLYQRVDRENRLIALAIRQPVGEPPLANGTLVTLTFDLQPGHLGDIVRRGVVFSPRTSASFGNTKGQSVLGLATLRLARFRTLVVTHTTRLFAQPDLGFGIDQQRTFKAALQTFLGHHRVEGLLVDLSTDLDLGWLYQQWDAGQPAEANEVLLGSGGRRGLHGLLLQLQAAFPDVEHLLLIGDDRIVPFARMRDSGPLSEADYIGADGGNGVAGLPHANASTVKKALAANYFLSDDPLASREPLASNDLDGVHDFVLPGLGVGRLVENSGEILGALIRFVDHDGLVDLRTYPPGERQVMVAGHDFSIDSALGIGALWRTALGAGPGSPAPVDDRLIGNLWRDEDLFASLAAGDARIHSLNGHANHDRIGSPLGAFAGGPGVRALEIYGEDHCGNDPGGESVDFGGAVVIGMSCHGGLPVPGSCADAGTAAASRTLDLAQTFLARGALAYGDNSGFGWGLVQGSGLGERLALLIQQGMAASWHSDNPQELGTIVRQAKLDYYLRQLDFDTYDRKSLMQWTLYGFPMLELSVPRPPAAVAGDPERLEYGPVDADGWSRARRGNIVFARRDASGTVPEPPPYLTPWGQHVLFPPGDYHRVELADADLPDGTPCPVAGCYWQLTGLSTDEVDLPMQPFLSFYSEPTERVQRGVLWLGARYGAESPFHPVVATPVSSTPLPSSGTAPLPIRVYQQPTGPNGGGYLGGPSGCSQYFGARSQIVVSTGELKRLGDGPGDWEQRLYGDVKLEILFRSQSAEDCTPPVFGSGSFDHAEDGALHWHVPVTDSGSGVWRVIAVWDDELEQEWKSVDLSRNGDVWEGLLPADPRRESVTYFLQAVDREGNVAWWERTGNLANVTRQLLEPIERSLVPEAGLIFADGFESGDCTEWNSCR